MNARLLKQNKSKFDASELRNKINLMKNIILSNKVLSLERITFVTGPSYMNEHTILSEEAHDYFKDIVNQEQFLDNLIAKNKRALDASPWLRPFFNALKRGIRDKRIVLTKCTGKQFTANLKLHFSKVLSLIAFLPFIKNIIKSLKDEYFALHILGYFNPATRVLRVVVENNPDAIIDNENRFLDTVLHEMCHLAANDNVNNFSKLYKNHLDKFYTILFETLSQEHSRYIEKVIIKSSGYEHDPNTVKKVKNDVYTALLSQESAKVDRVAEWDKWIDSIITKMDGDYNYSVLFMTWWTYLTNMYFKDQSLSTPIWHLIYDTYKDCGWSIPPIYKFYQELLFPSEVICVYSREYKNTDPNIIRMLEGMFRSGVVGGE
jgi:hypothetical protein